MNPKMKRFSPFVLFVPFVVLIAASLPASAQCPGGQCKVPQYGYQQPPQYGFQQPPQQQQPVDVPAEVDAALANVVTIDNRGYACGSGVYLGNGYVLTAHHIFFDDNGQKRQGLIQVSFPDGSASRCESIDSDDVWDLCLLKLTHPPASSKLIVWAKTVPQHNEALYASGYGERGILARVAGRLTGFALDKNKRTRDQDTLIMTGGARPGDSGGPVFNRRGELAGILWGTDGRTIVATQVGRCWLFAKRWIVVSIPHQQPQQPPAQPPLVPVTPIPQPADITDTTSLSIEIAQLRTEIEVLREAMVAAQAHSAPGPPGPPGPQGEPGPAASVDTDALAEAVREKIQGSIRVKVEPVVKK